MKGLHAAFKNEWKKEPLTKRIVVKFQHLKNKESKASRENINWYIQRSRWNLVDMDGLRLQTWEE